jgi:protoporphyrinogen oxidase
MVADPGRTWIGLEYICADTDELWSLPDPDLIEFAKAEVARLGILDPASVRDGVVVRAEKAYPAYFGSYEHFEVLRAWLDGLENLYLIGRNGMHRYNNQDHSMLTAMAAVDNIVVGRRDKANIWAVNTEEGYHEQSDEG